MNTSVFMYITVIIVNVQLHTITYYVIKCNKVYFNQPFKSLPNFSVHILNSYIILNDEKQ